MLKSFVHAGLQGMNYIVFGFFEAGFLSMLFNLYTCIAGVRSEMVPFFLKNESPEICDENLRI